MTYFSYRHTVTFEETNLVGNVYFVNHLRWQGKCREHFLMKHAPSVLEEIKQGLALVTVRCSCDYLAEVEAFDQIEVRMRLSDMGQNKVTMDFEYCCLPPSGEPKLIARGMQQIASMRRQGSAMVPVPLPTEMREALFQFKA